jgi:ERCC4-type nuclease
VSRNIWIDDREVDDTIDVLEGVYGEENVTVKRMKSGDIVAPGLQAAAERKQINDFLKSAGDPDNGGRLWSQMRKMEKQYDQCALVVEGSHLKSFVADIYGGHSAAIRKVLGVTSYFDIQRDGWSAYWVPADGDEGTRLLGERVAAWFRQIERMKED